MNRLHSHRPWPRPRSPWVMRMMWHDLAFLHWPVPVAALRPFIPEPLRIDTYDGRAWIGLIPFHMTDIRLRGLPALPGTHTFTELNVRTYVTDGRRPGVWFFSLDAAAPLACRIARLAFGLNYLDADMHWEWAEDWMHFRSDRRAARGAAPARLEVRYRPAGPSFTTHRATLKHWLTDRYCMYSRHGLGPVLRSEIDHAPWQLQRCEVQWACNEMLGQLGLSSPDRGPHAMFAKRCDALVWPPGFVARHRWESESAHEPTARVQQAETAQSLV